MTDEKKSPIKKSAQKEVKGRAKGGVARAKSLTAEKRSAIAKDGAIARWGYKATHMGNFKDQFGINAECYILNDDNKTPVVTKTGLAELLGLGSHARDVDQVLNAQYMSNFRDLELLEKMKNPFKFQFTSKSNTVHQAYGYNISVIVDIGKALIDARDSGALPPTRLSAANSAQKIINASAKSGITDVAYALAGFQPEAQAIIDSFKAFVREEARQYEKEFPDELYEAWYRIYQLNKPERGRPFLFSKLTNEQIYIPLARSNGKILDIAKKNKEEHGKRGDKIHQFLAEVGVKALKQQIGKVLAVTELFSGKKEYEAALAKVNKS
ncbi:TPA: P63C domain-containing protein [Morganella morganii]|uniref:P63C domain-containing protein n=1 Tax=Morganella morganii TaxID=582 RepID=UPI0034E45188